MSRGEYVPSLPERQEAMRLHWPDHPGYCTLRHREWNTGAYQQCGVEIVPLTVDSDYLSVRCPSCRVVSIHQRIVPFNG